jgi:hypothetical protein
MMETYNTVFRFQIQKIELILLVERTRHPKKGVKQVKFFSKNLLTLTKNLKLRHLNLKLQELKKE